MKMHEGQFEIDAELVTRLLSEQLPDLAALPISRVRSTGTVNALFRLGDGLCVRVPLVERWANALTKELEWLPWLSERLSMRIPEPVAEGHPTSRYPFPWAVYRWIEGEPYSEDSIKDERIAGRHLGQFVRELRAIDVMTTAPRGGRRPLRDLDAETRAAILAAESISAGLASAILRRM